MLLIMQLLEYYGDNSIIAHNKDKLRPGQTQPGVTQVTRRLLSMVWVKKSMFTGQLASSVAIVDFIIERWHL